MPNVKWRKAESIDLTPEDNIPIGKNVLELKEVKETANFTCIAVSPIGTIEARTLVKVQGNYCMNLLGCLQVLNVDLNSSAWASC
jgi:hypothetical protein